jgi:outer membrane protein
MRHFHFSRYLATVLMAGPGLLVIGSAQAQARPPAQVPAESIEAPHAVDQTQWALGAAFNSQNSPYRGVTKRVSAIPLVLYESRYLHFFGTTFDLKLPTIADQLQFTFRAKYALGDGYKASDSANLQGMEDRKGSVWGGVTAVWDNPFVKLSAELLTAGSTKGSTVKLSAEHGFIVDSRFKLTPHASAVRMNSQYVDYYYGVKSNEVTADRAAYTGQSTTNVEVGLRADYALTPKQLILLDVSETRRGSGITNSPLVDKSSSFGFRLGYLYKF